MKAKTKSPEFIGLTVWVDNRLDNKTTFTPEEIKEKFLAWYKTKDTAWIEYYWFDGVVREFITSKEGLNGTFNESEYTGVYVFLYDIAIVAGWTTFLKQK